MPSFKGTHFQIIRQSSQFSIVDLSKESGTIVNGVEIHAGSRRNALKLRRGLNEVTFPEVDRNFGFLISVG